MYLLVKFEIGAFSFIVFVIERCNEDLVVIIAIVSRAFEDETSTGTAQKQAWPGAARCSLITAMAQAMQPWGPPTGSVASFLPPALLDDKVTLPPSKHPKHPRHPTIQAVQAWCRLQQWQNR